MFYVHVRLVYKIVTLSIIFVLFLQVIVHPLAYAQTTEEVIETGDATAVTELHNVANSNVTSTMDASSTLPVIASSTNIATVESSATTTAETGENVINGEAATIVTGDGFAVANVVNIVNTNILNSDGFIQFFTALGLSTLDVRNLFTVFETDTALSTAPCAQSLCGSNGVVNETTTNNTATINNSIIVRSNTGENTIDGSGNIVTGDAYAAANIFNLSNINITDSNYLLVSINNLGDLDGDIVLPTAALLEQFFANAGVTNFQSNTNNTAVINNSVEVVAETGENESNGGTITTGDAQSSLAITNKVNQNEIGGSSFLILLRVHGNWSGDIYGLPDNLLWSENSNGVTIYDPKGLVSGPASNGGISASTTNVATINNNISVFALTGDNKIGNDSGGQITTGDAYAAASVTNLANLNIFSQNWALLIFDIFGDWGGNITFGRPDLWLGVKATSDDEHMRPGSWIDYTYTISNLGDTPATNVSLTNEFDSTALNFTDGTTEQATNLLTASANNLGTIKPGETREVVYRAQVGQNKTGVAKLIPLTASVSAHEQEDNLENNSDTIVIQSGVIRSGGGRGSVDKADLSLYKTVEVESTTVPATVDYEITIKNDGGPLHNAVLVDTLTDSEGKVSYEGYWNLDKIAAGEVVTVTYTMDFASTTDYGIYTNTAHVTGTHRTSKVTNTNHYKSPAAFATINIQEGKVLGISTCSEYLKSYLKYNQENDYQEVEKLQQFLSSHLGIDLKPTGFFGEKTLLAVKAFQQKYNTNVLAPWGIDEPSGYVYLTTRKAINEIVCKDQQFPLSDSQEAEIQSFLQDRVN